jgi:hypothetical protein
LVLVSWFLILVSCFVRKLFNCPLP